MLLNNAHSCCDVDFWENHLRNVEQNERAELKQIRGLRADTLREALDEMQQLARVNPRVKNFMYHADFNPRLTEHLTDAERDRAFEIFEEERGIPPNSARVVMEHVKHGRGHWHVIWYRLDDAGRPFPDSLDAKIAHRAGEKIALELGFEKVISPLTREPGTPRPPRAPKAWEMYRAGQSGITIESIEADLAQLRPQCENGKEFQAVLDRHDYILARGDRMTAGQLTLMIIDPAGDDHAFARRLRMKTKDLNAFMRDLDRAALPDIHQAKQMQQERRIAKLEADRDYLRDEIKWEEALDRAGIEHEERERRFVEPENRPEKEAQAEPPKVAELFDRYINNSDSYHSEMPGLAERFPALASDLESRMDAAVQKEIEAHFPPLSLDDLWSNENEPAQDHPKPERGEETRGGAVEKEDRPPAPAAPELGKLQGEIRLARTLSHGPQSFVEGLRERDLLLSRVTPEDIARDLARLRGQWEERRLNPQSWMEHEGGYEALNPDLQESARRSFDTWKERQRQRQNQQDGKPTFIPPEPTADELQKQREGYVEYVQRQWAQGPRSHLAKATGGLAVVTRYGSAFVLTERNMALEEAELKHYLERIDRNALPTVAQAETEQRLRMAEKAARRDTPLNKTAAQIRLAYALTQGPGEFTKALNKHGLRAARTTAEEVHTGQVSDNARAGDVVILDRWGNIYELNQRTTGDSRANAQAFLAGIDANLPSINSVRREQQEKKKPPFRDEAALGETAGKIRLAYALTQGPGDFTQALDEHGLRPARVTDEEIQAGQVSEKARAGDVVILNRWGKVYELNQRTTGDSRENAQAFLAGIDTDLPSITTIRREQQIDAERPLNEIAGNIRLAYTLSRSAEGFTAHLNELGLKVARATHDEAERSRTASAFSREIGRFAPEYYDGQYVLVTPRGHAYALNRHTTGQDRAAIEKFMATLDPARVQDIETTQRQARNEWHWPVMSQQEKPIVLATGLKMNDTPATSPALHFQDAAPRTAEPEPAPAVPANLRGIAAEIWTAYNARKLDREWQRENADGTKETMRDRIALKGGRDPHHFGQALEERGLILARATKEEADQSREFAPYWNAWSEHRPTYQEGEFVVIDRRGEAWKLTERTTGHAAREVQAFLNKAEWKALPGIEAGRQTMKVRTDERLAVARDRAAHWDAIRLKNATRKHGRGQGRDSEPAAPNLARASGRVIGGAISALGKLADGFSLDALTPKEKYEAAKRDARNEREADTNADYAAYMAALAEQRRRDQQRQAEQRQNEPEPHPQRQR